MGAWPSAHTIVASFGSGFGAGIEDGSPARAKNKIVDEASTEEFRSMCCSSAAVRPSRWIG